MEAETGDAQRAVTGDTPVEAALGASGGVRERARAWYAAMTDEEQYVTGGLGVFVALLLVGMAVGVITPAYMLNLLSLAGLYVLLSMGLNVQWGYTGLINFSVAAFFGVGAYTAALLASPGSPLTGGTVPVLGLPIVGVVAAMVVTALVAVLIGIPTLSLRGDYLAIASLGLAEVVRIVIKNEAWLTGGVRGVLRMPRFFDDWPVVGGVVAGVSDPVLNLATVTVFVLVSWLFLRRVHRSPWGRAQRLIRSDPDLAEALGKDTFRLRMESFVIGSVIIGLAGVFFVHLVDSLFPTSLEPIRTFYVWIAVILGGSGSDRGAILGGVVIVTVVQGPRFLAGEVPLIDAGALRLLVVGLAIVLVMRLRPQGVLPPQRELVWPGAEHGHGNRSEDGRVNPGGGPDD